MENDRIGQTPDISCGLCAQVHTRTHTWMCHTYTPHKYTQYNRLTQLHATRKIKSPCSLALPTPFIITALSILCIKTNSRTREVLTDTAVLWLLALSPTLCAIKKAAANVSGWQTLNHHKQCFWLWWLAQGWAILPHPIRFCLWELSVASWKELLDLRRQWWKTVCQHLFRWG